MRRSLLGPLVVALGCGGLPYTATVDLRPAPGRTRPLPVSGLQQLGIAVEVEDARPGGDPHYVGRQAGVLFLAWPVRSSRDVERVVRSAVVRELRAHDLRVVPVEQADALLRVRVEHFHCSARSGSFGLLRSWTLHAELEGGVSVVEPRAGEPRKEVAVEAWGEHSAVTWIVFPRRYDDALEKALREFAARVVRHPDLLVALHHLLPAADGS